MLPVAIKNLEMKLATALETAARAEADLNKARARLGLPPEPKSFYLAEEVMPPAEEGRTKREGRQLDPDEYETRSGSHRAARVTRIFNVIAKAFTTLGDASFTRENVLGMLDGIRAERDPSFVSPYARLRGVIAAGPDDPKTRAAAAWVDIVPSIPNGAPALISAIG